MRVAVFSTKSYDRQFLSEANGRFGHDLVYFEPRLTAETTPLAAGFPAICTFVNDVVDRDVLARLAPAGLRAVAQRSAGFNNIDLAAAERHGISVLRVPAYSPHAVAEHTVGMILALNRKLHRAYGRVREGNFSLEGLLGFDLVDRVVGIIGTGRIGALTGRILGGFGCRLLAFDPLVNHELVGAGATYVELPELFRQAEIISLHCPLSPQTRHLINRGAIAQMRRGVMLINTSRGAIIDTSAVIAGLKSGQVGWLGIDVYEEEADLFFEDLSGEVIQDDIFARLLTFPNVLVTAHQAFFTREALEAIARTTLGNVYDVEQGRACPNAVLQSQFIHVPGAAR